MARLVIFALALSFSLFLSFAAATPGPIHELCQHAGHHYKLCVEALSTDPSSSRTIYDHDLAKIALHVTSKNATKTATGIAKILVQAIDNRKQQACLTECFDEYVDAVDQLADAEPALDMRDYEEVRKWVEAARAGVKACQNGCKDVLGQKDVLTKKNSAVIKLCTMTLKIVRHLMDSKH